MKEIEKRYGPSKSQIRAPTDSGLNGTAGSNKGKPGEGDTSLNGSRRNRNDRSKSNTKSKYM